MAQNWSKTAAFAYYGAKGKNPRWSWSARSPDGKTVVLTLWADEFDYKASPVTYDCFGRNTELWTHQPGNKERIENLIWARDHCDGLFRVVITVAEDVTTIPRKLKQCHPKPEMLMRLTELDEVTGEFRAEITALKSNVNQPLSETVR